MIRLSMMFLTPLLINGELSPAIAAEQNPALLDGSVMLVGSIANVACGMRVGNESQTIILQPTALSKLVRGEASAQQSLTIYISQCTGTEKRVLAKQARAFDLTFEGESDGRYFNVQGDAQGIGLQIKDRKGKIIIPGMSLQDVSLSADTLALNYILGLVGSGHALKAGNYRATIKLRIQHF